MDTNIPAESSTPVPQPRMRALPLLLRPTDLRLASVDSGLDRRAYARSLIHWLYGDGAQQSVPVDTRVEALATAAALTLPDPEALAPGLTEAAAEFLRAEAAGLDGFARVDLASEGEVITTSYATALTHADGEVPAGTVVWVRETAQATVQFILGRLNVDTATGQLTRDTEVAAPPEATPPVSRPTGAAQRRPAIHADAAAATDPFFSGLLKLASSVSWALPKPWNVVVTGGLTLVEMLMGDTAPGSTDQPMVTLRDQLKAYIASNDLDNIGSDLHDHADQLVTKMSVFGTMTVDELNDVGLGYLAQLETFFQGAYGLDFVHNRCTHLFDTMSKSTTVNPTALNLTATGVTLWLNAQKMWLQLHALQAAYAIRSGDLNTGSDLCNTWLSDYSAIRDQFLGAGAGTPQASVGWLTQLTGQMTTWSTNRLQQITAVQDFWDYPDSLTVTHGYEFTDNGASGGPQLYKRANDEKTVGSGCSATQQEVDGKSLVIAWHTGVVDTVTADLNTQFQTAQQCASDIGTKLASFADLMPPGAPSTAPAVRVAPAGAKPQKKTPQGTGWIAGNKVSYAVQFVDDNGPSPAGPWSSPMTIGHIAFAELDQLPTDARHMATDLRILRRFTVSGKDTRAMVVGNLPATATWFVDDKHPDR